MIEPAVKLTTYTRERERAGGCLLVDRLSTLYAAHGVRTSAIFRGIEGFGLARSLRSARLLSISEDLPIVGVAVDRPEPMLRALGAVQAAAAGALVAQERAYLVSGEPPARAELEAIGDAVRLTIYVGRRERAGGRAAHLAVVDLLHEHGLAGATVLLGVDGTAHGGRARARALARNADVPMSVLSVGGAGEAAAALPALLGLLSRPVITVERVSVRKRDGRHLAPPGAAAKAPPKPAEGELWHKLTVYTGEQARHAGRPIYAALVDGLREAGADGVTVLRGVWGYHGDHDPHGETFWSLRRRVPVVAVALARADALAGTLAVIDAATTETGLVTSELLPVVRARRARPGLESEGRRQSEGRR